MDKKVFPWWQRRNGMLSMEITRPHSSGYVPISALRDVHVHHLWIPHGSGLRNREQKVLAIVF